MFFRPTSKDYNEAYESGRLSPSEVIEKTLHAIRESDRARPSLGAFIELRDSAILDAAKESDERWRQGKALSALDGVPVAIKDEFDVEGYRTRAGTTFLGQRAATKDASVVERLRRKGAIILGKTHMTEIGMGGVGVNPHFPAPRNPFDPFRMTGGSSSGSAAAVAAGLCPIALGSDAGGSIRMPASLCGIYGLKPTFGRLPTTGGALLAWSLDHAGPLGASINDVAMFYDATSGRDSSDRASQLAPHARRIATLRIPKAKNLKVAWCPEFADDADEEVRRAFHEALATLREMGAKVEKVSLKYVEMIQKVGYVTFVAEAAASQADSLRSYREEYNLDTRLLLAVGERVSAAEYLHAQRVRSLIRDEFLGVFGDHDLFLNPTLACTARPIERAAEKEGQVDTALNDAIARYTFCGTLTGFPALSIPCGVDRAGLPIGLQIMARPWADEAVLRYGAALDQLMPAMPKPKMNWDILGLEMDQT